MSSASERRLKLLLQHLGRNPSSATVDDRAWTEASTDFSSGPFTPVLSESNDMVCHVEGKIPSDLCGIYMKNGPNPQFPPKKDEPYHFFDGDGMIVSFQFFPEENKCVFNHKYVHTERFLSDQKNKKSAYEFGSMAVGKLPDYSLVVNEQGIRMGKANTALLYHQNKLYALEDADLPYQLEVGSLKTIGRTDFNGTWKHNIFTAHPKLDPETGELIGYGCAYGASPVCKWEYSVISPQTGTCVRNFPIHLRNTSYNHDFAATKNYSICYDGNLVLNFDAFGQPGKDMWEFRRDIPGRIGVFPRYATDESSVKWFEVPPYCVSHTANAYEEGNEVVIVANCIGFESFKPKFPRETPTDPDAKLREWRLNLQTGEVKEQSLRWTRSDFPVINPKFAGKRFRYLYAQLIDYEEPNHAPYLYGTYKYDLVTRTHKEIIWGGGKKGRKGRAKFMGCEAFFVAKKNSQREDDGYLIVIVNNMDKKQTELRVYDASTFGNSMRDDPLVRVVCPRRLMPLGTHGLWLSEEDVLNAKQ